MDKEESFASKVKEEIVSISRSDENKRALLSAFIKINGHIRLLSGGKEQLELSSSSAQIAKLAYTYIHDIYGVSVRFAYTRSAGFLKRMIYHVIVDEEGADILDDLEIDLLSGKLPKNAMANEEQAASYLSGAFLASGSINNPKSSSYHLEIALTDEEFAKWLIKMWSKIAYHQFSPRLVRRRGQSVAYLKKGEEISDFLILVGAKACCLEFENVRVDRDFRNVTNRLSNLDSANMGKTIKSSEKQLEEIKYFKSHGGLNSFGNPKLAILMELREEHPDASLNELSVLMSEELSMTVTKSNINHLFRFLEEEYQKETNGKQ